MAERLPDPTREPDPYREERLAMVAEQLADRGITDPDVLAAMRRVPRQEFVPASSRWAAYHDSALPIGHGQTISQPYIVGLMTSLAQPVRGARVLEVGAGSGYQAAVLAELGASVVAMEIIPAQAERAGDTLARLGYDRRVRVITGDGFSGYPEGAPYAAILVTCAVVEVPAPLAEQLAPDGRLILPLGDSLAYQTLSVVTPAGQGRLDYHNITGVVFVPMTGPHGFRASGGDY